MAAVQASRVKLRDGSRLARLEEALDVVASRAVLAIEVKEPATVSRLLRLLYGRAEWTEVWSSSASVVREAATVGLPTVLICQGLMKNGPGAFLWEAREVQASAVSFYPADLEPHVAAACRNAGVPFYCGTPNDPRTWDELLAMRASGIITDLPLQLRQHMRMPGPAGVRATLRSAVSG